MNTIEAQIEALMKLSTADLRQKHEELFGEPIRVGTRLSLIRKLAWRIQSLAEGGLSERAQAKANELARDSDLRVRMPNIPTPLAKGPTIARTLANRRVPLPGTKLVRSYKDQTIEVLVLPKGFEFQGQIYRSLSAIAKHITGSHWNGYKFFHLDEVGA